MIGTKVIMKEISPKRRMAQFDLLFHNALDVSITMLINGRLFVLLTLFAHVSVSSHRQNVNIV